MFHIIAIVHISFQYELRMLQSTVPMPVQMMPVEYVQVFPHTLVPVSPPAYMGVVYNTPVYEQPESYVGYDPAYLSICI